MRRALIALAMLAAPAAGQDDSGLYARAVDSTVWLVCKDKKAEPSFGTGIVVGEGLVLTSYHVIDDAATIQAFTPEREGGAVIGSPAHYRRREAGPMRLEVAATDRGRDLALLRVTSGPIRGVPIARASKAPSPGEPVFCIGSGESVLFRYSGGHVRQSGYCSTPFPGYPLAARMIEVSIPVNVGDSGGPLLNSRGEMVGIVSYIEADKLLVSKAIDVSEVEQFLATYKPKVAMRDARQPAKKK